jgi:DNA-binding Lrp family transcriptional regulator
MSARAYLLLDIADGKADQLAKTLRGQPGVMAADILDGRPDIIVLVEAADRLKLAQFMMPVLDSIDRVTNDMRLMVTRETLDDVSCVVK